MSQFTFDYCFRQSRFLLDMADFVAEITLPVGPLPAELLPQSAVVGVIIEIQCEAHSQIIDQLNGANHGGAQAKTEYAAQICCN